MEPKEVVLAFYDALSNSDPETAAAYLAEDYTSEQPNGPVQDKAG